MRNSRNDLAAPWVGNCWPKRDRALIPDYKKCHSLEHKKKVKTLYSKQLGMRSKKKQLYWKPVEYCQRSFYIKRKNNTLRERMRAKRYAMNVGKRIPQNNNIRFEPHHTYTINHINNLVLTTKIITGVSILNWIIHQMSSPGKYRENIPPRNSRLHLSETQNFIQNKICFRWKK